MSDQALPQQWLDTPLENVILKITGGGTPSKSKPEYYRGDIPWMSVKDMDKHVLKDTVDHISLEAVENSSTNIIPAGTPIIATRMSLGKIVVAHFDSAINQDLKALFLPSEIHRDYLVYWYRSFAHKIEQLGTGTTVKGIRLDALKTLECALPPLAEQKVIADKLDTLLAQADRIKARLERIPEILKRFRQSVLAAAVSGRLTEDWRSKELQQETAEELLARWETNRQERFNKKQLGLIKAKKSISGKKYKKGLSPDTETLALEEVPASWVRVSVSQFAECLDNKRIPVKKSDRDNLIGKYPYFGANGEVSA